MRVVELRQSYAIIGESEGKDSIERGSTISFEHVGLCT